MWLTNSSGDQHRWANAIFGAECLVHAIEPPLFRARRCTALLIIVLDYLTINNNLGLPQAAAAEKAGCTR